MKQELDPYFLGKLLISHPNLIIHFLRHIVNLSINNRICFTLSIHNSVVHCIVHCIVHCAWHCVTHDTAGISDLYDTGYNPKLFKIHIM